LFSNQVQFTAEKFEEPITGVVDDSAEPFDSFVLSPSQFQPLDSIVAAPAADAPQEDVAPVQSCQDDDEALALLDELLQGNSRLLIKKDKILFLLKLLDVTLTST
jgi:hypothetical protein